MRVYLSTSTGNNENNLKNCFQPFENNLKKVIDSKFLRRIINRIETNNIINYLYIGESP